MRVMPKKITLEKLAQMIQRGFSETKSDVHRLEDRIHKLEGRMGDAGDTLDAMSNRLDAIELELKYIRDEMQRLDYVTCPHSLYQS